VAPLRATLYEHNVKKKKIEDEVRGKIKRTAFLGKWGDKCPRY